MQYPSKGETFCVKKAESYVINFFVFNTLGNVLHSLEALDLRRLMYLSGKFSMLPLDTEQHDLTATIL